MIYPNQPQLAADVARHYDARRPLPPHLGDVHHGYWRTGRESPAEAAQALVEFVVERLAPEPGHRVIDIGCGYGATAAWLAAHRQVDVSAPPCPKPRLRWDAPGPASPA